MLKDHTFSTSKAIVLAAVILGISFILSGGLYESKSPAPGVAHIVNKFTGSIKICVMDDSSYLMKMNCK